MSFLDNLENNLKALENREERDPEKIKRDQERRDAERNEALARAPHAEALKTSPFTSDLLTQCRTIGHGLRVLVRFTWIGENLRLEYRAGEEDKRMELAPTPKGIVATFSVNGKETGTAKVNPAKDDAAKLASKWIKGK